MVSWVRSKQSTSWKCLDRQWGHCLDLHVRRPQRLRSQSRRKAYSCLQCESSLPSVIPSGLDIEPTLSIFRLHKNQLQPSHPPVLAHSWLAPLMDASIRIIRRSQRLSFWRAQVTPTTSLQLRFQRRITKPTLLDLTIMLGRLMELDRVSCE